MTAIYLFLAITLLAVVMQIINHIVYRNEQ
jgi:hypothetical protein